ncbi:hypothetical protein B0H16DRAFT_1356771 [Mycena metata]|uniref:F-box domain-containing protein n=1 Tax=Mycena metata TaxID=1033252 RepID=A0AAD7P2C2_9AGAR|nr:hypothetical protein B0H16DRAFT_1356771 [Mycena metata]
MTVLELTQTTETMYSPIHYLPAELLIEIFILCSTRTDPLAPLTLARVSCLWRQVVQSSPRVWRYIYLDDRSSIASSHAHAGLWTRQSYPLTFDVHLDVSESSRLVLPLLSPLLPLMNRWRYYSMSGKREESVDLSGSLPNCVDPLVIVIQDPDQLETEDEGTEGLPRPTFTSAMPAWLTMNIWVSELPKAPVLVPLRFSSIVMTENIPTQPRSILEFLCSCPQLEAFFFTGWQHDDETLTSPLPIARLPNLRTLHIRSTCGTRSLLSSIDAPRLSELHLAHLNVDFTLGAPPEPVDGDSEDEARDFSRSASSDRATGMGLRALLLRSNPPLRVLDMDWSDMRTKDFRFAFARLGVLEHFFIEASDMSDKVIELLRPYVPARGGKDERVRVRLPRLKSLELSNCNELSGEALVEVLSERVRLTDGFPAWEGNTLKEVIISDCAGLKGHHGNLLRRELGNRLRLRD